MFRSSETTIVGRGHYKNGFIEQRSVWHIGGNRISLPAVKKIISILSSRDSESGYLEMYFAEGLFGMEKSRFESELHDPMARSLLRCPFHRNRKRPLRVK